MATVSIKGWLGLVIVLLGAGLIVSWGFGLALVTAVLLVGLVVVAPIVGLLVAIFLPLPGIFRVIAALSVSVLILLFGLQWLGVL